MNDNNHTELCERLSADAGDVGKNYSSPIGHRIDDAVMLIEQLAARIAELEKERDALIHDNAQFLKAANAEATLASEALAERDALKADSARWREFAEHQTWCADCADSVSTCPIGNRLSQAALQAEKETRS